MIKFKKFSGGTPFWASPPFGPIFLTGCVVYPHDFNTLRVRFSLFFSSQVATKSEITLTPELFISILLVLISWDLNAYRQLTGSHAMYSAVSRMKEVVR